MEKLYYTIGEVAGILGEQVSLVRFWNNSYPGLFSAKRNAKGNRFYVKEDVETFKQLHYLVKEKGMKLVSFDDFCKMPTGTIYAVCS